MSVRGTRTVEEGEFWVLVISGPVATVIGAAAGLVLFTQLVDAKIQAGFWTTMLTVAAVSALPLVAMAVHLTRIRRKPNAGEPGPLYTAVAVAVTLVATTVSLLPIILCLYQVAITSGSSEPNNVVLALTTTLVGASVGATVVAIAFGVLDKINPPPPGTQ